MSYTLEHFIPRTPQEIWGIVTDWKVAEYWLGVKRLRPVSTLSAPAPGWQLTHETRGMLHPMTITAWQPLSHLGLSSEQGGITAHYDFSFEPVEGGTRVVRRAGCSGSNAAWRVAAIVLEWIMRLTDRGQLVALDRLVRVTTGSGR